MAARPILVPAVQLTPRGFTAPPAWPHRRVIVLPDPAYLRRRPGLGAIDPGTLQIGSLAASGAATTGTILSGLSALGALSPAFAVAGPIGAAVAGLAALGFTIANMFSGCGQTCVIASQDADQVGAYLAKNLNTYVSAPVRYRSMQLAALNTYDFAWKALTQACSDPALGAAGQRCISDRQQGACTWKAKKGYWQSQPDGSWTWVPWGAAGSGPDCWNWFVGMRDPIANDPGVQPDPASTDAAAAAGSSLLSASAGSGAAGLLLPAALVAGALLL